MLRIYSKKTISRGLFHSLTRSSTLQRCWLATASSTEKSEDNQQPTTKSRRKKIPVVTTKIVENSAASHTQDKSRRIIIPSSAKPSSSSIQRQPEQPDSTTVRKKQRSKAVEDLSSRLFESINSQETVDDQSYLSAIEQLNPSPPPSSSSGEEVSVSIRPSTSTTSNSAASGIETDISKLLSGMLTTSSSVRRPALTKLPSNKYMQNDNSTNSTNKEALSFVGLFPPLSSSSCTKGRGTYSDLAFEQYVEMMKECVSSDRWQKKHKARPIKDHVAQCVASWLLSNPEESTIDYKTNLKTFQRALQQHGDNRNHHHHKINTEENITAAEIRKNFSMELKLQGQAFLAQQPNPMHFNAEIAADAVYHVSCMCARNGRGMPVSILWGKLKEMGLTDQKLLQSLLYVASTFTTVSPSHQNNNNKRKKSKYSQIVNSGMSSILDVLDSADETVKKYGKDDDDDEDDGDDDGEGEDQVDLLDEIAIYHDLLYPPNEATISIRVRMLVSHGLAKDAEKLILANSKQLRLRACVPVLRLHLEQGDLSSALSLYKHMRSEIKMPLVLIDVETYVHLLAGLAEHGVFFHPQPNNNIEQETVVAADRTPPTFDDSTATPSYGPKLFNRLVKDMAAEIIELPEQYMKRLSDAFAKGDPTGSIEVTTSLAPLQPSYERASDGALVVSRVRIEPTTGECFRTGVKLQLIALTEKQKEELKSRIIKMAKTSRIESPKTLTQQRDAGKKLQFFWDWMDQRRGEPYTAIIDGANAGYYFQNFRSGRFSYHQIKFVVDSLEQRGETPIVILPNKYTYDTFINTVALLGNNARSSPRQVLTQEEKIIRDELHKSGQLFAVPPGFLDDYYWILASIASQTESRKETGRDSLNVPVDDPQGRWPGTRPILITNDQMRDHKLEMLDPILFRRWCSNYIVNYNFAPFVDGECSNRDINFAAADFFSREIQGNKDKTGSMVWHFPIQGREDEWFCVRIPKTGLKIQPKA